MADAQFSVRIWFTETVEGEKRSFSHDSAVVADDFSQACASALAAFDALARHSSVGWVRIVERVEIQRVVASRP